MLVMEKMDSPSLSSHHFYIVLHLGTNPSNTSPSVLSCQLVLALCWDFFFTCGNIVEILLAQLPYLYGRQCLSADALVLQLFHIPPHLCYCLKVRWRALNIDVSFGEGNPAVYCSLHAVHCEFLLIVSTCVRKNHFLMMGNIYTYLWE